MFNGFSVYCRLSCNDPAEVTGFAVHQMVHQIVHQMVHQMVHQKVHQKVYQIY